jgi:hypothetical protein
VARIDDLDGRLARLESEAEGLKRTLAEPVESSHYTRRTLALCRRVRDAMPGASASCCVPQRWPAPVARCDQ